MYNIVECMTCKQIIQNDLKMYASTIDNWYMNMYDVK